MYDFNDPIVKAYLVIQKKETKLDQSKIDFLNQAGWTYRPINNGNLRLWFKQIDGIVYALEKQAAFSLQIQLLRKAKPDANSRQHSSDSQMDAPVSVGSVQDREDSLGG